MSANANINTFVRPRRPWGPLTPVLDLFSSVWFGISLLVLILVYSWVGSAGVIYPQSLYVAFADDGHNERPNYNPLSADGWHYELLRQRFEVTEMEWFGAGAGWIWFPTAMHEIPPWTFRVLMLLLCITLTTVTIRRIPLKPINAGVWTIHVGIITLCIGCVIYFGRKFEGDVLVFQRKAVVTVPGAAAPATFTVMPDATTRVGGYEVRVVRLQPNYEIKTEPYAGRKAYAVTFSIDAPAKDGSPPRRFLRQMLINYPQFTEDIILGADQQPTRAIKAVGKRVVDEDLHIKLDYAAVNEFYLADTTVLYARMAGEKEWKTFPLEGLPRYSDRVSSTDEIWTADAYDAPKLGPFTISAGPVGDGVTLDVSDFLIYARIEKRWSNESEALNPRVALEVLDLVSREAKPEKRVLFAESGSGLPWDVVRTNLTDLRVEFQWVEDADAIGPLLEEDALTIEAEVVDAGIKRSLALKDIQGFGAGRKIEGTEYKIELLSVLVGRAMPFDREPGPRPTYAAVRVSSPSKGEFTRLVAVGREGIFHDIKGASDPGQRVTVDENLKLSVPRAVEPRLVIVAGPEGVGTQAILRHASGKVFRRALTVGQETTLVERELAVRATSVLSHAKEVSRAAIVPRRQRQGLSDVRRTESLVYVTVRKDGAAQGVWVPFSQYIFENQWMRAPKRVSLPDGSTVELLYGRKRQSLPTWVALDWFEREAYTGGTNDKHYTSFLRFADKNGQWTEPVKMQENLPAPYDRHWLFQATWDPPRPGLGSGGWNHTGLGVGNREGVGTMLTGVCISVTGMLFAFYVKPVIKRRRRAAVLASLDATPADA